MDGKDTNGNKDFHGKEPNVCVLGDARACPSYVCARAQSDLEIEEEEEDDDGHELSPTLPVRSRQGMRAHPKWHSCGQLGDESSDEAAGIEPNAGTTGKKRPVSPSVSNPAKKKHKATNPAGDEAPAVVEAHNLNVRFG